MFHKYQHIERYGHAETTGIEDGQCVVFPKIDGTNASVWVEDGHLQAGSRKRHLSMCADNHGFCAWVNDVANLPLQNFFTAHPDLRLFGEWLVPHTIKTYRDDAWRRFYVFDVVHVENGAYLYYDEYSPLLERYGVDYIPCMAIVNNGRRDQFFQLAEKNDYLMKPGEIGEGIVIKNYAFKNQFGRTTWAKIVRSEFKETNHKTMGVPVVQGTEDIERKIVIDCITKTLVDKERAKIESDTFSHPCDVDHVPKVPPIQPRLLQTMFYCLVTEELWPVLKKLKNPTIDFKRLNRLTVLKTKEFAEDLF